MTWICSWVHIRGWLAALSSALTALSLQRWDAFESFAGRDFNLLVTPDGHLVQFVQPNNPFIDELKTVIKSIEYAWAGD